MAEKIVKLSHNISEKTPGYGGEKAFHRDIERSIKKGDTSNNQLWKISSHLGTHVDCPYHFDARGKKLDEFSEEEWVFYKPYVWQVEAEAGDLIEQQDCIPKDCDFLIIKTGFERFRGETVYWKNNPGLSPKLGKWIREHRPNIKMLGLDFISITSYANRDLGRVAHRSFLDSKEEGKPVRVIEDMSFENIDKDTKFERIVVAPLMVEGSDGAPVTVYAFIK